MPVSTECERHLATWSDQLVSCGNALNLDTVRSATRSSHVLLAERRLKQGQSAELAALMADVLERIGALAVVEMLRHR